MLAGIIPKEDRLYETLGLSSTGSDSYGRDWGGGLQAAEKSFYFRRIVPRKIPPFFGLKDVKCSGLIDSHVKTRS